MKKYSFLFKPVFFIFNLIFATWLVLKIESVQPSDFGRYQNVFEPAKKKQPDSPPSKVILKSMFLDYRKGKIDSVELERRLEKLFPDPE